MHCIVSDHLTTLDNCLADIESNCNLEMSENDTAEITACQTAGAALASEIDDCIKPSKSLADSCSRFIALSTDNLEKVKGCDISGKNKAAQQAKKNCTKGHRRGGGQSYILLILGFAKCKKAEDAVVDIVDQCKPERKCGGAGSKAEAEKQLAILSP